MPRPALAVIVQLCSAGRARAKRSASVASVDEFWAFVAAVYALVLLPAVALVLFAAARDPAARELCALLGARLKQLTCRSLGAARGAAIHHHASK